MPAYTCVNDGSLGPGVRGCRGDFDFTLRFEHVFLSLLPSSLFIVLATLRIAYLSQHWRIIEGRRFQFFKLVQRSIILPLRELLIREIRRL